MSKARINKIHDIYDSVKKKPLEYVEMQYKYGNIGNYIDYYALIQNIPSEWWSMAKI